MSESAPEAKGPEDPEEQALSPGGEPSESAPGPEPASPGDGDGGEMGAESASAAASAPAASGPAASPDEPTPLARQRLATARTFVQVAERIGPDGGLATARDSTKVGELLWHEALYWALASTTDEDPLSQNLDQLLAAQPEELLRRAAKNDVGLQAVRTVLADDPRSSTVVEEQAVATVAQFTQSLLFELESPVRQEERRKVLRLAKVAAIVLVTVVTVVMVLWWAVVPKDLAQSARMTTSSQLKPCVALTDCGNAVFHTRLQQNPWVMYDLGAEHQLSLIKIHNRSDCCFERAAPLIVETSLDARTWKEQTRRTDPFLNWSHSLDTRARYVRLRVPKQTYFHLGPVVIR